jgi:hypothetical protein
MSLAAKLPYSHPYANGFGYGGTNVPTDTDGLDYLSRMATADGAGLETGVAGAIDRFIKACKTSDIWDSIRASCILAGARSLNGALVPLRDYGPELWDDPNPSFIVNSDGSAGTWDAATNTMFNAAVSTSNTRPRFDWGTALPAGKTVRITGRFSGDVSHIYRIAAGTATVVYQPDINPDGSFAATVVPTSSALYIYVDGTLAPTSVTIESLSIREVIAAPTNLPVADGFASGDYSRTAGLTGDGTSYLNSGRRVLDDADTDHHIAAHITAGSVVATQYVIGGRSTATPTGWTATGSIHYSRSTANSGIVTTTAGLCGISRSASDRFYGKRNGLPQQEYQIDVIPGAGSESTALVFTYNTSATATPSPGAIISATIAFYSIGESLSLEALDTAVTNLMADITFFFNTGLNPADYDTETVRYVNAGYAAGGTLE